MAHEGPCHFRGPATTNSSSGTDNKRVAGQGRRPSLLGVVRARPHSKSWGLNEDSDRGAHLACNGHRRKRIDNNRTINDDTNMNDSAKRGPL